ncbi:MAG: twin-arginine translocase subunit TatC [Opitutaceae bacterium]
MPFAPPPTDNEFNDGEAAPGARGEKTMGFLDHLEELRWTLVKCAIVAVLFATLSGIFLTDVRAFLEWPWTHALANYPDLKLQLRTDTPMEVYGVMVQICVTPALVAAAPFMLFFLGQFVGPALSAKEKRVVVPGVLSAVFLFLAGSTFSFLLLVPASIKVAIEANQWMGYQMIWTVGSYYSLMTWLVVGMGAVFEFPLLVLALTYLGIVEVATFRRSRRLVIVICFVAAAVITPTPDPITQTLVAMPLWALFEISLLIGAHIERKKAKQDAFDWRKTYGG